MITANIIESDESNIGTRQWHSEARSLVCSASILAKRTSACCYGSWNGLLAKSSSLATEHVSDTGVQ